MTREVAAERRRHDSIPALIAYAFAPWRTVMLDNTLARCRMCGDRLLEHTEPCQPGTCVSAGCSEIIVDTALGLCGRHEALVRSQRTSRSADPKRWRKDLHG